MPLIDGRIVLQSGIGTLPGGQTDLIPEVARLQGFCNLPIGTVDQRPVGIRFHRFQKCVAYANRVVGVLPGYGQIGLGVPVRIIGLELNFTEALTGKLNNAIDVVVWYLRLAGRTDGTLKRRVFRRL